MQNMHMPSSCPGITAPHIQHFKTRQYIQRLPLLMLKQDIHAYSFLSNNEQLLQYCLYND